jgi:hypothetical protein
MEREQMEPNLAPGRQPTWKEGSLYAKLRDIFPEFRTPRGHFDVPRLAAMLNPPKSLEAVYQWLRVNRMNGKNADAVIICARAEENAAALQRLGRPLPTKVDLIDFL